MAYPAALVALLVFTLNQTHHFRGASRCLVPASSISLFGAWPWLAARTEAASTATPDGVHSLATERISSRGQNDRDTVTTCRTRSDAV